MGKSRLDQLLIDRGLVKDRRRAQALVMAGKVFSGTTRLNKPGSMIAVDSPLDLRGRDHPWVSRGGVKLAHGLDHFAIDPRAAVALDIGASTGGFSDVLLRRDAARVYAVDVGRGQLAWKLRGDPRMVVLEGVNARYLDTDQIPQPIDLIVCDAGFIGLAAILPAALALAAPKAHLIALIKPQFEAAREAVEKGGLLRDPTVHRAVCDRVRNWLDARPGWSVLGLTESPITGRAGNVEYLIAAHHD